MSKRKIVLSAVAGMLIGVAAAAACECCGRQRSVRRKLCGVLCTAENLFAAAKRAVK